MTGPVIAADVDDLVRRFVRPDDHLHLAATHSRPNALGYALCRVFGDRARFTVSTTGYHSSAHALTLAGGVAKVVAGFLGDTYPSPRPNPLYERVADGVPFTFEPWSLLSYNQRLIAGATGAPYAVTGSLSGTDLLTGKGDDVLLVPDPDRPGEQLTLVRAMRPDLTLVHGVCADEDGNIAMVPPLGEGAWAAYAAKRGVIASVERIVTAEELRAIPDRVVIPGQRVLGLCEAPLGAHPQALRTAGLAGVPGYLDDYAFLEEIVDRCRAEERGADWYREWVLEPGSHAGYLAKLGEERRRRLTDGEPSWQTGRPAPAAARTAVEPLADPAAPEARSAASAVAEAAPSRMERLIVLGARAVVERVREGGYDTLLAGIGSSHLAAWLAAEQLRQGGHRVKVMAELGLYGFAPQQGDVFLFSLRHAAAAEQLSGIPEILGGMVAANPRALGVLAAAEIDESGTINTSMTADGRWLTGSGGANDIAASADCVVIATASRWRYVPKVAYRTSRGDRVREVVSQFGRFRRDEDGGAFRLATWLGPDEAPAAGPDDPDAMEREARAAVAASTGWSATVTGVSAEKPVTAEELRLLRTLDPEGRYR
ncbi:CoA-transferase [Kitasatospora sp. NBC_00315]|uniref:CoA-transferase n=1 Tax=Kitasatospora sp. NBC_00315 TaxID=2975963 RepID=UPI003252EDEA